MVRTSTQKPMGQTGEGSNPAPQDPAAPAWPNWVRVESQPLEADPPPPPFRGRMLSLWLDDEECAVLNQVLALARRHGFEPSEAQILRALLRVSLQHPGALDQVLAMLEQDGGERRATSGEENPVRVP